MNTLTEMMNFNEMAYYNDNFLLDPAFDWSVGFL
jgi:hypothetical protein